MSEVELLQIIHQFEEENAKLTKEIARLDAVIEQKDRAIQSVIESIEAAATGTARLTLVAALRAVDTKE